MLLLYNKQYYDALDRMLLEPRCYHAATSERRHIRLKADYYYIALRGASIRRSQRGNSEAIFGEAVTANKYYIANGSVGV